MRRAAHGHLIKTTRGRLPDETEAPPRWGAGYRLENKTSASVKVK
jgi:hypothetical protein